MPRPVADSVIVIPSSSSSGEEGQGHGRSTSGGRHVHNSAAASVGGEKGNGVRKSKTRREENGAATIGEDRRVKEESGPERRAKPKAPKKKQEKEKKAPLSSANAGEAVASGDEFAHPSIVFALPASPLKRPTASGTGGAGSGGKNMDRVRKEKRKEREEGPSALGGGEARREGEETKAKTKREKEEDKKKKKTTFPLSNADANGAVAGRPSAVYSSPTNPAIRPVAGSGGGGKKTDGVKKKKTVAENSAIANGKVRGKGEERKSNIKKKDQIGEDAEDKSSSSSYAGDVVATREEVGRPSPTCSFPMRRVKRLIAGSEDGVRKSGVRTSLDAVFLINKASEFFLELFARDAYAHAAQEHKRALFYKHLFASTTPGVGTPPVGTAAPSPSAGDMDDDESHHQFDGSAGTGGSQTVWINAGNKIEPSSASTFITDSIKGHFPSGVHQFSDVPMEIQDLLFEEFMKKYTFADPSQQARVRSAWKATAKDNFKHLLYNARRSVKVKTGSSDPVQWREHVPRWIKQTDWLALCDRWAEESWSEKSNKMKVNRAAQPEANVHTCGSVSFATHKVRLEEELKRPAQFVELFDRCHKKKETGTYVSDRAREAAELYNRGMKEKYREHDQRPELDPALWVQASGQPKKGYVYGFGHSLGAHRVLSACSSSVSHATSLFTTPEAPGGSVSAASIMTPEQLSQFSQLIDASVSRHVSQQMSMFTEQMRETLIQMAHPPGAPPTQQPQPQGQSDDRDDHAHGDETAEDI